MKQFFRSVVFVLFVGGWALASAAVYVVRTPSKIVLIPKDQLGYKDTYVDTRAWTLVDDRAHSAVVTRLVHLGKTDLLAHTVDSSSGSAAVQLSAIAAPPGVATGNTSPDLIDKAKAGVKTLTDGVKSKLN